MYSIKYKYPPYMLFIFKKFGNIMNYHLIIGFLFIGLIFCAGSVLADTAVNTQVITPDSELSQEWVKMGNSVYDLGWFEDALAVYNIALKFDPANVDAWYIRGKTFFELGEYEKALNSYDLALQLDPKYADAFTAKEKLLAKMGNENSKTESLLQNISEEVPVADGGGGVN
jgi:tetratricopeptide (TPR) repeat protein